MDEIQPFLILSSRPCNIGLPERLKAVLHWPVNAIYQQDHLTIEAVRR